MTIRTPIPRPSGHFQAGSDAGIFTTIGLFYRSEEVVVERLSMRKIREVLRLKFDAGLSVRKIAKSLSIGHSSAGDYLCRFAASGLQWPIDLSDAELNRRLFPPAVPAPSDQRPTPDWAHVHAELRRPGVTLALLWQEYRLAHPQGFQYRWFCEHYRLWAAKVDVVMRQEHRAGEKLFVDYAGQTVPVIDRQTGEIRQTQIFVAVLGASSYTFAEATWSQKLPDWLGSHVRCFAFFGGTSQILIPDNLRSGVTKAHRYEPDINASYRDLAEHYSVAVLPARSRKPRDKAKVEVGVQVVERWILAVLRNRQFFSLGELNTAIGLLLDRLNQKPFKKLPGSRRSAFEALDRPALQALPEHPYVYAEWKKVRVHIDYHVEVDGHYYSVPYQLVKHQLEVRLTAQTVECFHANQRVASHLRSSHKGRHTTQIEHMPKSHREHAEWTPQRLIRWAEQTGPNTAGVIAYILERRSHPQHSFRACLGILRLGKQHGEERLEAACQRALALDACSYRSLESILRQGLEKLPLAQQNLPLLPDEHINLRGPGYYH